jgi:hypothetical protein
VIDALILSRASAVTAAGVTAVLAEIPVRQTLVGDAFEGDGVKDCASAASTWKWDGVEFELVPDASHRNPATVSHACALSVRTPHGSLLIPGAGYVAAAFVEVGGGRWAVVSGRRLQRSARKRSLPGWEGDDMQVLATAEEGAIRFQIDANTAGAGPGARRADRRTLWSASP